MYNWIAVGLLWGERLVVFQLYAADQDEAMKLFFTYCEDTFKAKPHRSRVVKLPHLLGRGQSVQQLIGPGGD